MYKVHEPHEDVAAERVAGLGWHYLSTSSLSVQIKDDIVSMFVLMKFTFTFCISFLFK